jgi:hypothetical protein
MTTPNRTEPKTHKFGQKWMSKSNDSSGSDDEINVKPPPKNNEYVVEVPKNVHKSKKQKKKEKGECFRCGLVGHFEEDCTSEPNINSGFRKNDPMGGGGLIIIDRVPYLKKLDLKEDQDDPILIKKAYQRLALIYHPDKNDNLNATALFQNILDAYNKLI